jgi:endoglycosylceramidase
MARAWIASSVWAVWLAACGPAGGSGEPDRLVRVEDGAIRLRSGEAVWLRGINLSNVSKYVPGHLFPLEDVDLERLLASGFNSVRLLTFWQAIMPAGPGRFDPDYLEGYARQAARLAGAGLFVIVDMHQDLYGSPFSPGAPLWACPEELRAGYQPLEPWWANYSSRQVNACFDHFWGSQALQAEFAAAWEAVAGAVCPVEGVLGFDLMNEPWPGSRLGDPGFDNGPLLELYLDLADRLEAVCPGRVFFLAPSLAETLGLQEPLSPPARLADRTVLAPHFYPGAVHDPGAGYDGDAGALERLLLGRLAPLAASGLPVWIGEYGGLPGNPGFDRYLGDVGALFDRESLGSALYEYSRADGGFALLDAAGARKAPYDVLARAPVPSLLPGPGARVETDRASGALGLRADCAPGRWLRVLWPELATGGCRQVAGEALGAFAREGFFEQARCAAAGPVEVRCGP